MAQTQNTKLVDYFRISVITGLYLLEVSGLSKEEILIHSNTSGDIFLDENVVKIVSNIVTKEVQGVSNLTGRLVDVFNTNKKGVLVSNQEGNIKLELSIGVIFGFQVLEVAKQVQESVLRSLSHHFGLSNVVVDIVIKEITLPDVESPEV